MSNWWERAKTALIGGSFLAKSRINHSSANWQRKFAFEELEARLTLAAAGLITTPQTYSGVLNDKIVFTSGGHGWQWNSTLGRYATDRGENNEMVEDFGNQEQMTAFADYALRAGATVVPMRPVGHQTNEVVLDNDSAGVTFSGSWSNSTSTRYYDEDYGASADAIPYRFASTVTGAETATATYTPNIPQAGFYPVYAWVLRGTDRTEQTYRVNHTGGSTEITIDHSKVGSGWVYLGTYHFNSGSSATGEGSVVISNKTAVAGKVVIADAIRFGNGMGDWVDTPTGAPSISGYPREEENSFHWIARSVGVGTTLATATGASTNNNVSAPSNFAEYMFAGTFGEALYVGFHSNAGGGRGARGLIDNANPTPHQGGTNGLADILGDQINQDMQALNGVFEYNWTAGTTSTYTDQFGEINLGASAEMDATIIEVAFHDSAEDAAIMRDPAGRDQIARSVLQGAVQYFSLYGSPVVANTNLPSEPANVRVVSNASGAVTLNWAAGLSSPASVYGNPATGYKVYASVDGYGFDGGRVVAGAGTTTLTITGLDPNTTYYFKVTATNAGGESTATEVVAALPSGGAKQVLVVNGFDRFDRTQNFRAAYLGGTIDRVWPRFNNSHDYVVQYATAIQASQPGIHMATASNEDILSGAVNLSDYSTVIWILGTESTADDTFNSIEQTKVTNFINAGGNLFLSGAEIGWDLDQQNNGRSFYESTLLANYVVDDAGTYTATANGGGIFAGMSSFVFSNGSAFSQLDGQLYDVAYPDVIAPQSGAISALTYSGGTGGTAAIQVQGTGGKGNIVMFAFPFEAITNATRRQNAMGNILSFLGATIAIETRINGQDADATPGPVLAAGGTATLTYLVTNPGIVSLSAVSVLDDNGTPGNAADDFNATYVSGDANSNGQLDVGETWTYTATRTIVAGQTTRTGKATGIDGSTTVSSADAANYFGSAPGIAFQSLVGGEDADSAPGPTLAAFSSTTFTYVLTNSGNIALANVILLDDNGTPGNTADDFSPGLASGDMNSNNLLDVGETWTYSANRVTTFGQVSKTATVSGEDSIGQPVSATDGSNYFGSAPGVDLQQSVSGDDADSAPGPSLAAGGTATLVYTLTNTGNVPLINVVVIDDNGSAGSPGDDFSPAFIGGDTNGNNQLDVDETWTYSSARPAIAGQVFINSKVSAQDSIHQTVLSFDATNYVVVANADFNSDAIVDAGDYVMWRKNSGITAGATLSQGDANGDGIVDGVDYDLWRSQFSTTVDADGAMGIAASDTTPATYAGSTIKAGIVTSPVATSSSDEPLPNVALAKDTAFGQFYLSPVERRMAGRDHVRDLRRTVSAEWHNGPASLLTILANAKSDTEPRALTSPLSEDRTIEIDFRRTKTATWAQHSPKAEPVTGDF